MKYSILSKLNFIKVRILSEFFSLTDTASNKKAISEVKKSLQAKLDALASGNLA